MMQRLDSLIDFALDETREPYFYAVINGASPSGSLTDIYQQYEVKQCASLFEGSIFQGNEKAGPWLLQLASTSPAHNYPYTSDWGFYLYHQLNFQGLFKLLQSYLTAQTAQQTVLVRWWDPRILFHLLQDLSADTPFINAIGLVLFNYQNAWYINPSHQDEWSHDDALERAPWILQATDFASYRQSDYYIKQLAIAISENWLRYDQEKWRTLNNANQPLYVQLIPIITSVKQQGVHEYQHIEQFCHFAITHHKSPDWLLSKKTNSPQSWLANLSKDLT
ncbi:DUF4123 domain-containing protein [Motilimonas sp. KMU-193]|uniref:DUF4123 domain-containing protein n=1 Tax=Motilimonas sp. KMU-193 TaxID=3388668 RepID=UPI00396B32C1